MRKYEWIGLGVLLCVGFLSNEALARDLISAGTSATSQAKSIALTVAPLGIFCGVIVMQIPKLANVGLTILGLGMVGTLFTYGATSYISLLQAIFGSS